MVVCVLSAARPTVKPLMTASRAEMPGFFSTTSPTALVMSTARSMTAPEAPMKMLAMNIRVRLSWEYPEYSRLSE